MMKDLNRPPTKVERVIAIVVSALATLAFGAVAAFILLHLWRLLRALCARETAGNPRRRRTDRGREPGDPGGHVITTRNSGAYGLPVSHPATEIKSLVQHHSRGLLHCRNGIDHARCVVVLSSAWGHRDRARRSHRLARMELAKARV